MSLRWIAGSTPLLVQNVRWWGSVSVYTGVSVLCSHSPGSCSDCNKEDGDLGDRRDPEVSALVPFE